MTEIIPGIYIGNVHTATNLPRHISTVINCTDELTNVSNRTKDHYLRIGLNDSGSEKDLKVFVDNVDRMVRFVELALSRRENVLFHCFMGISRSCSMATAFLLSQNPTWSIRDTIDLIIKKKPNAFNGGERIVYYPALKMCFS